MPSVGDGTAWSTGTNEAQQTQVLATSEGGCDYCENFEVSVYIRVVNKVVRIIRSEIALSNKAQSITIMLNEDGRKGIDCLEMVVFDLLLM